MKSATVLMFRQGLVLGVSRGNDLRDWGMPGGYVEPGETPAEAASRELREETGISVDPVDMMQVYQAKGCATFTPACPVSTFEVGESVVSDEGIAAWILVERITAPTCTFGASNAKMLRALELL